jgi:hypothetical protein
LFFNFSHYIFYYLFLSLTLLEKFFFIFNLVFKLQLLSLCFSIHCLFF